MADHIEINGVKLFRTCSANPEQYEAFLGKVQIGYLRLRHGCFRADYPDCGDETVYEARPEGDGAFYDDEREGFLTAAVDALLRRHATAIPPLDDQEWNQMPTPSRASVPDTLPGQRAPAEGGDA